MKAFPWLIAGLALGAAAVVIAVLNEPAPAYADPDVERAANKVGAWSAKQQVKGTGGSLLGSAKEKVGDATGNYDLADEGVGDQVVGEVKNTVGKAAGVISDALKDFNRS